MSEKTKYEILKEIDLKMLVNKGIISIFVLNKFQIYEHFMNAQKKLGKQDAIIDVLETFNISLATFYNSYNEMMSK